MHDQNYWGGIQRIENRNKNGKLRGALLVSHRIQQIEEKNNHNISKNLTNQCN